MINITNNIQDVIKRFKALPGHIERVSLKTLKEASETITRMMKKPGRAVRRPIRWDSVKQREAYFASDGFGKGIPYRRSDDYINAWQSTAIAGGYQSENIGHKAALLAGTPSGNILGRKVTASGQSHIHQGTWQLVRPVVQFVLSKLPEKLLKALKVEVNV